MDLALTSRDSDVTGQEQCVDWLLVQSVGFKNSAAMTCGHLLGTDRQLVSRGRRLLLHFHSSDGRQRRRLKGFRVLLTGGRRLMPLKGFTVLLTGCDV